MTTPTIAELIIIRLPPEVGAEDAEVAAAEAAPPELAAPET